SETPGSESVSGSESSSGTAAPTETTPAITVTNPPVTVPAVTVPPAVNPVYPLPVYPVAAPVVRIGDGPVQPAVTYTTLSEEQTIDAIAEAGKGGTVQIKLGSNTKTDGAVIKEIADNSGVTAKFTLKNKYVWTVKSESISKARTVDLGVRTTGNTIPKSLIRSTVGKNKTMQFSLKQSGEYGFEGTLTVPVSKRYNGKYANLYRYNKSRGKLSFVDGSLVEAGKASFTLTEGGAYVIVFDSYIHGEDISSHAGTFAVPVTAEKASAGAVDVNFDMAVWEDEKLRLPSKKIRFRIVK
ncbi:MAG: hypothetical protein K2N72_08610, partial [Oscillospiraceae bacterium]|nr:hypothetical protein [Oscillospiraceae bacterium]